MPETKAKTKQKVSNRKAKNQALIRTKIKLIKINKITSQMKRPVTHDL